MELSTSTNILFERLDGSRIPVTESMMRCHKAGYRHLDFCFVDQIFTPVATPFTGPDWKRYMDEIAVLAAGYEIHFTQTHLPIHDFCNGEDEKTWELVKRSVESSHMLGAKWLVAHPSTKVRDGAVDADTHRLNVDYFKRLAEMVGAYGMGLAIENMWGKTRDGVKRYATDPHELCALIDDIGYENVGACWDTEHGSIEEIDQGQAIRLLGKRIHATHISDENDCNNIHILPYMGRCQWEAVLKALAEIGYADAFTYEIQHYLLGMPMELVEEALRLSIQVGNYMIAEMQKQM